MNGTETIVAVVGMLVSPDLIVGIEVLSTDVTRTETVRTEVFSTDRQTDRLKQLSQWLEHYVSCLAVQIEVLSTNVTFVFPHLFTEHELKQMS